MKAFHLTDSQRGVYFECIERPGSTMYNIPFMIRLPASIDEERFIEAVKKAASLHPSLFISIGVENGEPVMYPCSAECTVERSSAGSAGEACFRLIRPFDLEKGPLCRFELCSVPEGKLFLMDCHHTVLDGTSFRVLIDQISACYSGNEPPREARGIFDISESESALKESPEYLEAQRFFREKLEGYDFDSGIIPDVSNLSSRSGQRVLKFAAPEELGKELIDAFAEKNGVTRSTVFMSAFAYALSVFSGTKDSCFTTVNSGRHDSALKDSVGMFVRTLPLRIELDPSRTIPDYLNSVQRELYDSIKHDCISFGELIKNYGVNSDFCFIYQSGLLSEVELAGETVMAEYLNNRECMAKLLCMVLKKAGSYELGLYYDSSLFSDGLMESFADTVFAVIGSMLSCDTVGGIQPLGKKGKALYGLFNSTETPCDMTASLGSLFDEAAAKYPDRTALVFGDTQYTFSRFDRLSANIASYISAKGIGEEDFAAVLAPRNDMAVLAAWGIIRAGACFQPLDPTYPAERLSFMVKDSGAKLLIADRDLLPLLNEYSGEVLYTDEIPALPDKGGALKSIKPGSAAAIIYTSGTTGTPKGCVLEHRNLTAFFLNHTAIMGINEQSRVATYASFGFDAGLMDIVTTPLAGAALYIVPDEIRLELMKLEEFYCGNGITHGFMTTQVGRMFAEQTECRSLKALLVGGEKLVPFSPRGGFRFINGYGPCETMAYVCHYEVKDNSSIQPIGKPGGNTKLYTADSMLHLLPAGGVGELCIAGLQVGRGYLGQPGKTAAAFVENPFTSAEGYERIYRTGDIVRLLPDGNFEFIGRRDSQVKVRGFRIELTEVEEIIRRYPGIKDATVAAFDDPAGGKFIAAYVTDDEKVDVKKLGEFIRAEKPAYMVPAVIMQLDAIPYTQNQKVNRRALPAPERVTDPADMEKPGNEMQRRIFDIAAKALGHEAFGIDTDFLSAGMTSISALKFTAALGRETGKTVKMCDIKEHDTVRALAGFLSSGEDAAVYGKAESYPLMQNQKGVFIESNSGRAGVNYNIPVLFRLSDGVDADRLKDALCAAINAHPYIKAELYTDDCGDARVCRNDSAVPAVEIKKTDRLPSGDELVRPFELLNRRLYRAAVYVTGEGNYLFLDVHHLIADGTSLAVLFQDVNRAYAGLPVEAEVFTGFEAALEEERLLASGSYAESEKYFEQLLYGCNTDCFPAKCPESGEAKAAKALFRFDCSQAITRYCAQHNLTANAFFNAAFAYTLSVFLHTDDVSYCTVYNGRNDSRSAESFAMFVKTLPVRCVVDPKAEVAGFAAAMQRQLIDTMANDLVSFADLSNRYGLSPDIFFNYQGDNFIFDSIGGEKAELLPLELADAKAPFSIEVFLKDGVYTADVTYRKDCLCREFVASFVGALQSVAESFTRCRTLDRLRVISDAGERNYSLLNSTEKPFENLPWFELIEDTASKEPGKTAVKTRDRSLSFAELSGMSNRLANALVSRGVGAEEIVGFVMDRTELVPVGELGIGKAGGAFLNMLPSYPDDRLDFCMRDAGCRYVISTKDIIEARSELFSEDKPYKALCIDELIGEGSASAPAVGIDPRSLAYCIYTSGSTGTPKGVMIEHHNFSNFVQTAGLCELEEKGGTVLCIASISFDMSISEMLFSLCRGKTIYIAAEEEIHNLDLLLDAFRKNRIDIMMMTPSLVWSLLSLPEFEKTLAQLNGIVLGAEAFPPALYSKLKKLNPDMLVMNGYGPTECTQACSAKTLTCGDNITIGTPFANMKFYVIDDFGRLLPRYAVGELFICGEGVCRGYVKLPEKNAEAFGDFMGMRGYHTGDLVRVNRDNEFEFGGRADNQVKLRGFRIELDEVESVMTSFPGVSQSKVTVRNNGSEDFLAGFFTADRKIDTDELAAFMKTKLTYYMVPAAMLQIDKMPMTPNGKLDKKALPEITYTRKARAKKAPKRSLEERILDLFRSTLGIDDCYVDDNFFEIGGTSLSASKVVMQIKAEGYKIEYQDIFDHQTAEELAEYLEGLAPAPAGAGIKEAAEKAPEREDNISELLKYNSLEYAKDVERRPLGDVLLTGATGFLGSHILKALLDYEEGRIICLLRKGVHDSIETRLKATMVYYFEDDCEEAFRTRIVPVEGSITDENLSGLFRDINIDTVINCAASVKHYANDNSIEFTNVHGVENMIALTKEKNAKMIQISTSSVPGAHTPETYKQNIRMKENQLFVIDDMNNQYCRSKYQAELRMLDAIKGGMRGKIIRVGNLMGRHSDGEFQTNMHTNAFLNGLRGFVSIGKCPISHATDPMSFSPIDCTAHAVVLLAGTNDMFTAFHAESRSTFDEMKIFEAINRCGIEVKPVSDEEYYSDFYRMMADPKMNEKVSALLTNDRPDMHMVEVDNRFTANVLYRLGFSWPFVDDEYLERVIKSLDALDFFFMD